jgi:hypothetical protein
MLGGMEEFMPRCETLTAQVYPSLNGETFGWLLRKFGYVVEPAPDDGATGYRVLTRPKFTAKLQTPCDARPGEFAGVFLYAYLHATPAISAAVLQHMRWKTLFAHLTMHREGHIAATQTILVSDGITESYLRNQLACWTRDLEDVRRAVSRQARLLAGSTLH